MSELGEALNSLVGNNDTDSGQLGYYTHGSWRVVDPDDPKKFLVRFINGTHVSAFHMNKVPQKYDLNVIVGKDHLGRPTILGEDRPSNQNYNTSTSAGNSVGFHSHVRGSGMEFITDEWMWKHLRITPSTGLNINITAGSYLYNNELQWKISGSESLSAFLPTIPGFYKWVVIGIDPTTNDFVIEEGDEELLTTPSPDPTEISDIEFTELGYIPLGAIWLLQDDTSIPSSRIQDLRHALSSVFWYLEDLRNVSGDSDVENYVLTYKNGEWIGQPSQGGSGGGGQVDSVVGGKFIDVDDTDPANPIVNLDATGTTTSTSSGTTNALDLGSDLLHTFVWSGSSAYTINGIDNGIDGNMVIVINAGTALLSLSHQSGSASAADRIISAGGLGVLLSPGQSAIVRYQEGSVNRWREVNSTDVAAYDGTTEVRPVRLFELSGSFFAVTNGGNGIAQVTLVDVPNHSTTRLTSGTLGVTRGGTGLATVAQGDILYASSADTLARLAKDTNATRYLSNTGTSNNPLWALINLASGVTGTLADTNLNLDAPTEKKDLAWRTDTLAGRSGSANYKIELTDLLLSYLAQTNLVINGGMQVWQRGTSFVSPSSGTYTTDRWGWRHSGGGIVNIARSGSTPVVQEHAGVYGHSLWITPTTADASISSTEHYGINYRMLGYDFRAIAQRSFVISFWALTDVTGTYCVCLRNGGGGTTDRTYVAEYALTAGSWTYVTLIVPPSPSAGTWDYENSYGLDIRWMLAAGSSFHTTSGAWNTGNFLATSNQVNWMASTSNNFRITGVDIRPGEIAVPYFPRSLQDELLKCKTYYQKSYPLEQFAGASSSSSYMGGLALSTNRLSPFGAFPVEMRAAPTIVIYNPFNGDANKVAAFNQSSVGGTVTTVGAAAKSLGRIADSGTNFTTGTAYEFQYTAEAEL